jgi:uncharacterized membrane protein
MLSDKFRRQLRQEAEQWRTEGLIDASVYEQLSNRYQFSDIETAARNRFTLILLGLGSVLLGLGIITFVAANWQVWSREWKVILLLSGFVGINAAGFYLWRRPTERWQRRLGQGLLLLGALVLGANMALMSQLFHQSGLLYQLFIAWGLGVLAMAYSLRLTSLGILAELLIGLGYLQGQPAFVPIGEFSWLRFLVQHMPVFAGVMFIPLAYWCRSRWIFRLGAIAVIYTLEANLIRSNLVVSSGGMAAIACALPPALLWAYQDFFWKLRPSATQLFSGIAHSLAIIFLSVLFYFLSFYGIWNTSPVPSAQDTSPLLSPLLVDISILSSLTVWVWLQRVRLHQIDRTTIFVVSMIAISGIVPFWHLSSGRIISTAVWIFNLLLFLLGVGLIRQGLTQGQRRLFWGGMVLLTLQIFTRMLEYDTDLLFKSVVLLLCGFGVLAAGLWFERYLRVRR